MCSSHEDFDAHYLSPGEICDYGEMKEEMLSGLALSTNANWSDIPDLDFDISWLDFGDVFEVIFERIGAIIGGIFDGLRIPKGHHFIRPSYINHTLKGKTLNFTPWQPQNTYYLSLSSLNSAAPLFGLPEIV